jgi:hypothetical protein
MTIKKISILLNIVDNSHLDNSTYEVGKNCQKIFISANYLSFTIVFEDETKMHIPFNHIAFWE